MTKLLLALLLQAYPPLPPHKDLPSFGAGVQRTMGLLASSTPQRRNPVRILFYGQSITEQGWWKLVAEDLRARFPHADLVIENRAIGGFASQILVRTAEADLYPFQPDLLISHVYGANNTYEEIIRNVRTRTCAEVLVQRDHVTKWPAEKPDANGDKGLWWDHMMNNVFLPDYAKKYGCGLADVRGAWLDYLRAHRLEPKALLSDDVHLNAHGQWLMAEIVKRYLVHKPSLSAEETVRTLGDLKWDGDRLRVEFDGNRVDLVGGAGGGTVEVLVDGKRPSAHPEAWTFTRTSSSQAWGPAILRVSRGAPLAAEDWTLKILEADEACADLRFSLSGSVTGPDGEGRSKERFASRSGRVVIEPGDWWLKTAREWTGKKVAPGFEVRWKAVPLHVDSLVPEAGRTVTLIQGIPNGPHVLELRGKAGVAGLKIYRPPVR